VSHAAPDVAADRLDASAAIVVARTVELCAVPGLPLQEHHRAALVAEWWAADGLDPMQDAVGNVWACVRAGDGAAVVVAAHLDTVFPPTVTHGARRDGDRLIGPSVGDDSVALAALSQLAVLLAPDLGPVWIVATIGEEGLGDLAGAKAAVADPPVPLKAFVAIEGNYLGRITTTAVGSVRYRIEVSGPGGHAWERADAPSAVHVAAALVTELAILAVPDGAPKRAVNVGTIAGGEAINARAQHCAVEVDLRSDDADALAALDAACRSVCAYLARDGVDIRLEAIGARPAGRVDPAHPVVVAAAAGLRSIGREPVFIASSTDANAALAAGIPAVTVGITEGAGEHTEVEWIAISPIADGLRALARTVEIIVKEA
jgi:acetylornithine deacetylase/succinyl-diaminopimelate desuccinylase-like protein